MLNFKEITIEDYPTFKKFIDKPGEMSCDVSFLNLLVWQGKHGNTFAVSDNQLIIRIGTFGKETYALPFGGDLEKLMDHPFVVLTPNASNPYKRLYTQN